MKITHSFNKIKINNKHHIIQPDNFAPYTKEYRTQRPRQSQPSQNMKIYPQNPTDVQNPQQMHIQNPFNTQSFQPIQPQNPMLMHSYQPTQMQNKITLPYYLQQHEITKNQLSNFSQIPNAAESLQMTMNPYLMGGSLKHRINHFIHRNRPGIFCRRLSKCSNSKFNFKYRTRTN